jgi:AraC-like DNA-binding protein/mannose-6-phosphate isomerase-like protein (cupin superfamily)
MRPDGASWRLFEDRIQEFLAARAEEDYLRAAAAAPGSRARRATTVTRHTSDCHEFFLVAEGRALLETPGGAYELTPGKLLLIEPGVEHEELPASPDDSYLIFCIMARGTTADLYQTLYLPHAEEDTLRSHLGLVGSEPVAAVAGLIGAELEQRREGWREAADHLIQYLGRVLQRRFASGSFGYREWALATEFGRQPALQAALFYCAANLRRAVRLEDVAAAVGYSPSYLSRMFTSQLGASFSDHLRTLRMGIATSLLLHSALPVREIAQRVGYAYPWHFTRAFRQATGLSPREFRRRADTRRNTT